MAHVDEDWHLSLLMFAWLLSTQVHGKSRLWRQQPQGPTDNDVSLREAQIDVQP